MDAWRLSESFFCLEGKRGTGPICRNGPEGALHKLDLSPFFPQVYLAKGESMTKQSKKAVIAYRKTCPAKGTGLSHYILMDKKAK
jgi:modified peptide precursor CbpA